MPLKACVLGFPVAHSLSPALHGYWLKKYNIDGAYTLRETPPEKLKQTLDALADEGFAGCNLTLPLKEHALALMDELDGSVTAAGAVNTVVLRDGKKTGYNSDGFGFMESLKAQHPGWDGARVVILGAGGAARGIIAALRNADAKHLTLINRTQEKAEKLAADLKYPHPNLLPEGEGTFAHPPPLPLGEGRGEGTLDIVDWSARSEALENATLLINCTSLGMAGQPPLDIDLSPLPIAAAVCDIIYRPLLTPLLMAAKKRGQPVVEGLPMLLHQGRLGFRHWFGVDPAVTQELYNEIARRAT